MKNFDVYKFQRLSVSEGLSQNTVYSVIQDKKGFMWFCTQQGLNRYDGFNVVSYKNIPGDHRSLPNNFVNTLYMDSEDILWTGTLNGGLSSYNKFRDSFNNYSVPGENYSLFEKYVLNSVTEKNRDELFIATSEEGLKIFSKKTKEIKSFNEKPVNGNFEITEAYAVYFDNDDNLWIGTWNKGLYRYSYKSRIMDKFCFEENNNNSLSNDRVRFIFRDSRNNLWIGTSNGLNRFDSGNNNFERFRADSSNSFEVSKNTFTSIAEDKNGILWIGTKSSGLLRYNSDGNEFTEITAAPENPDGLGSDNIFSLYSDRSNVLWIGTFNSGVYRLDCEAKKFYGMDNLVKLSESDSKPDVTAIEKDDSGNIWIGTAFEGLYRLNIPGKTLEHIQNKYEITKSQKHQTVLSLYKDNSNIIWAGTLFHGLNKFDLKRDTADNYSVKLQSISNPVHSISNYFRDGNFLWVGSEDSGLLRFGKLNGEFIPYSELKNFNNPLSNSEVKSIFTSGDGIVWAGTIAGGLNRIDFDSETVTYFLHDRNNPLSVSENCIVTVCEDNRGNIWAGSLNNGLNKFIKELNGFKRYTTGDGLSDNAIRGIIPDNEGNLWISTNNGISKFTQTTGQFRNYDESDGLQSREFNLSSFCKSGDGILYFGGINGFNYFKPDEITDNPYLPSTVITDFQIFNKSVNNSPDNDFLKNCITEAEEITLSYRESVFSFEFASLIFNNPEKNKFAYRMEGFDKEWIYCGSRRFVTYTNLEPGIYFFRVKSSNNDGIWDEDGASVKIIITPPFWKTLWFKSITLLSVISATGLAYRQKLSKIEKEKKSQEEFSRKLLESQELERKKIASELHDTIAHDVLITKNKISLGLKNIQDSGNVKNVLEEISELASNTLNDVRSISYNLHPHQIDRLGLTKAIKSIINNVSKSTEIEFVVSLDNIDSIFSKELEMNIFRIIQECFNNIIKHSEATESELIITKRDNILEIYISDNGKGFPKKVKYGMGMTNIEERVKLYNGQLKIDSQEGKGTRMNIVLPIDKSKI
ncbi:MAG: hypothetical protein JNJ56_03035 [Ignavibacteria bacterium]|nr:hypothetical protein [Ignavibacteria bacterium]